MSSMNYGTTKTFQIPIDHLDYKFIESCTDVKHLEKILTILRSGEEGCYPDLTECCEKRLESLDPKSRALRKDKPVETPASVPSDEWQKIHEDVENWLTDIKMKEKTIPLEKTENVFQERLENVPPVRGYTNGASNLKNKTKALKKKTPRDYSYWDKFDVEKECCKVDEIPERKSKKAIINSKTPKIEKRIDTAGSSEIEKSYIADHEKEKGNEAFRSGDFEEAVTYYTRSISAQPTAAAYNNRAQAEIKRQNWQNALNDCEKVLDLEPGNLKALLRRATANKHMNNYQKAVEDLKRVLHEEPVNAIAQTLLSEIEEKLKSSEAIDHRKGRRIPIEEIEGSDDGDDNEDGAGAAAAEGAGAAEAARAAAAAASAQPTDNMGNTQKKFGGKDDEPSPHVYRAREDGERKETPPPAKGRRGSRQPEPDRTGAHKSGSAAPDSLPATNGPASPRQPPTTADLKVQGNELFKHGQFAEAATKYSEAIGTLENQGTGTPEELSILYSNRAACYLKDGNLSNCIDDCSRALELQPFSIKPLLRRALACESMERYREAYVDYKTVLQIDNGIQSANDSINRITRMLLDQDGINWREKLPTIPAVPVSLQSQRWTGNSNDSGEDKQALEISRKKAEQRFLSLKQEGNAYVKKAQYKPALDKYSACLIINSDECSIYTNRALCYLKLSQFDEAKQDCDRAIQLDATSVKAFYRRALAYKGLQIYQASINDLNKVLQMDPNVSEARKELEEVTKSLKSETNIMGNNHEKQRKKIQIEEVNENDGVETPSNNFVHSDSAEQFETTMPMAASSKLTIFKPANAYEFGQLMNAINATQDQAACADLLAAVAPKDLPAFLSNKLEGDTFLVIIKSLKTYLLEKDPTLVYQHLYYLSKVERFQVILMLLGKDEKAEVQKLFDALSGTQHKQIILEDVRSLSRNYGL